VWPGVMNVTLRGVSKTGTKIDRNYASRCISIESVPGIETATIRDITIKNGSLETSGDGAGILARQNSIIVRISNAAISGNGGPNTGYGGGLCAGTPIGSGGPTVEAINVSFKNNVGGQWTYGAGACALQGSQLIMSSCEVSGNVGYNGGVAYLHLSSGTMENCFVFNNTSTSNFGGGGVLLNTTIRTTLMNCTIVSNEATNGGGGGVDGGQYGYIINSIIWGNMAAESSKDITTETTATVKYTNHGTSEFGGATTVSNTQFNPNFTTFPPATVDDLKLQAGSPVESLATDEVTVPVDYYGNPRPAADYSLGAHEI
ncbi:hypothetical protein ACFL4F_02120, partial [Candidatus Margulisiibacteriota bacterium]